MKNVIKTVMVILTIISGLLGFGQDNRLSDKESRDMQYMVEEEKLARDVYTYFGDKYGSRPFLNIQESEQRHMDMMIQMLEKNNVPFKLSEKAGVFFNAELQELYNILISQGNASEVDAYKVGKVIEDTDISDLEEAIKNTNDVTNINIYENLLRASENHLRAFNRQLSKY